MLPINTVRTGTDTFVLEGEPTYDYYSVITKAPSDTFIATSSDPIVSGLPTNTVRTGSDGFSFKKLLLQKDNTIYTVNGTNLVSLGTAPATDTMFENNSFSDTGLLTDTILKANPTLKLLMKTSNSTATSNFIGTPLPKLILAKNDITLSANSNAVDGFTITGVNTGSGILKIIYSVDSGTTWKSYKYSNEVSINTSDLNDVKTNGMSITEFNAISRDYWSSLIFSSINTENKIRFGYYFEAVTTSDSIYTDSLTIKLDMNGSWVIAVLNTDYTFDYSNANTAEVKFTANGDYRINL